MDLIIITGDADLHDEDVMSKGASCVMYKPLDFDKLLTLIKESIL